VGGNESSSQAVLSLTDMYNNNIIINTGFKVG